MAELLSFLKIVVPTLQTQPNQDVGALRDEVVKEQLANALPKPQSSQPVGDGVTETSSNSSSPTIQ